MAEQKKKGKSITSAGIALGSLIPGVNFLARPIVGGSAEALRQTLYPAPEEHGLQGLRQVAEAGGATAFSRFLGNVLGTIAHPISSLAKGLASKAANSTKTVPMNDLVQAINTKVTPALRYLPQAADEGKTLTNQLKAQLTRFGTAPISNIAERNIPMTDINNLRQQIGTLAGFGRGGLPKNIEEATYQNYYPILRDTLTKNIPGANLMLKGESGLRTLGNIFSKISSGTGEHAGPLYLHGLPNALIAPIRGLLANRGASSLATGLITPNLMSSGQEPADTSQLPDLQSSMGSQPQQQPNPKTYFSQQLGINENDIDESGQWVWDQQTNDWVPNKAYPQSPFYQTGQTEQTGQAQSNKFPITQEDLAIAMIADLAKGGKNITELGSIASQIERAGLGKLSPAVQDRVSGLQTSASIIQDSLKNYDKLGYGTFTGPGGLFQLSSALGGGTGVPNDVVDLNLNYENLRWNIARAFNGSRISDKDLKILVNMVPSIRDEDRVARQKLNKLQQRLKENEHFIRESSQSPNSESALTP